MHKLLGLTAILLVSVTVSILFGSTPSHAVSNRDKSEFESMYNIGFASGKDVRGQLLEAIGSYDTYTVQELLGKHTFELNYIGESFLYTGKRMINSPLGFASATGNFTLIEELIKRGAHSTNPLETILPAAENANATAFLFYYNNGLAKSCSDYDLFMAAMSGGRIELVQLLLERGHRFDIRQNDFLHASIRNCDGHSVTEYLLAQGADPNGRDSIYHYTPLLTAALAGDDPTPSGNFAAIDLLIKYGADPFAACNHEGTSFFFLASSFHETTMNDESLYELLQNKHCVIPNRYKATVIEHVLETRLTQSSFYDYEGAPSISERERDNLKLMQRLLALGATPTAKAITLASKCGFTNVAKLLQASQTTMR